MGVPPRASLNYSRQGYTDDDLRHLRLRQGNLSYEEVDFSQNNLSSQGLRTVINLCRRCQNLRVLKLYRNRIDDSGAEAIAELCADNPAIEEMHLSHNHFTSDGVYRIVSAAERARSSDAPPLWLRLEHNDVADPEAILRGLQSRFSICSRRDEVRCTVRVCIQRRKVHLPLFWLQRSSRRQWAERVIGRSPRENSRSRRVILLARSDLDLPAIQSENAHREPHRDLHRDLHRDVHHDVHRDLHRDLHRELHRDMYRESHRNDVVMRRSRHLVGMSRHRPLSSRCDRSRSPRCQTHAWAAERRQERLMPQRLRTPRRVADWTPVKRRRLSPSVQKFMGRPRRYVEPIARLPRRHDELPLKDRRSHGGYRVEGGFGGGNDDHRRPHATLPVPPPVPPPGPSLSPTRGMEKNMAMRGTLSPKSSCGSPSLQSVKRSLPSSESPRVLGVVNGKPVSPSSERRWAEDRGCSPPSRSRSQSFAASSAGSAAGSMTSAVDRPSSTMGEHTQQEVMERMDMLKARLTQTWHGKSAQSGQEPERSVAPSMLVEPKQELDS